MKRLFRFKYPKIALLILTIILAYFIFKNTQLASFITHLGTFRYFSIFLAGIFIAFGFTAPFAVGFFISYTPQNIWLAAIIGGLGAMVGDLIIFNFIRVSFKDEFDELKHTRIYKQINFFFSRALGKIWIYLMYVFAGIIIVSPLPDEAGVTMLAGLTKIKQSVLAIVAFILHTIAILILLAI